MSVVISISSANSFTMSGDNVSILTLNVLRPDGEYSLLSSLRYGISSKHSIHQVAHTFSSTT